MGFCGFSVWVSVLNFLGCYCSPQLHFAEKKRKNEIHRGTLKDIHGGECNREKREYDLLVTSSRIRK